MIVHDLSGFFVFYFKILHHYKVRNDLLLCLLVRTSIAKEKNNLAFSFGCIVYNLEKCFNVELFYYCYKAMDQQHEDHFHKKDRELIILTGQSLKKIMM